MRVSSYDKFPRIKVPESEASCVEGWSDIAVRLHQAIRTRAAQKTVVAVDCYTGVDEAAILRELQTRLSPALVLRVGEAMHDPKKIDALVSPFLGGADPVFGFLSGLTLPQFFDREKLEKLGSSAGQVAAGVVLIIGCGASLVAQPDLLVYADLPRWEAQLRFRRNEYSNLGVENRHLSAHLQYKRAYFVDWRVCDRWKRPLIARWDFVLDTTDPAAPKLAEG